jgi:hypothetical protein
VLSNGQDDIVAVRIVRDPETLVGKGFGYILFKARSALLQALSLNKSLFKEKWALRVTTCANPKKNARPAPAKQSQTRLTENASHALKRIKKQGVVTKKKFMQARKGNNKGKGPVKSNGRPHGKLKK